MVLARTNEDSLLWVGVNLYILQEARTPRGESVECLGTQI